MFIKQYNSDLTTQYKSPENKLFLLIKIHDRASLIFTIDNKPSVFNDSMNNTVDNIPMSKKRYAVDAGVTRNAIIPWMLKSEIEGQGPKVKTEIYSYMTKNAEKYFEYSLIQLGDTEPEQILIKLLNDEISAGHIFRPDSKIGELLYLSGDDLHNFGIVELENIYVAFASITSTNDHGNTIKFGDKQYANKNIQERGKGEYLRPLTYLLCIPKDANIFVPSEEHTSLIKNGTYNGKPIVTIFAEEMRKMFPIWSKNPLRNPINFTPHMIMDLAKESSQSRSDELHNLKRELENKLNWHKLNDEEKREVVDRRSKQKQNEIKQKLISEYRKTLSEDLKKIWDCKTQLEREENNDKVLQKKKYLNNKKNSYKK